MTPERTQIMDFSKSTITSSLRLILSFPEYESRLWSIVRPFQPEVIIDFIVSNRKKTLITRLQVWLAFLVTIAAMPLLISLAMYFVMVTPWARDGESTENSRPSFMSILGRNYIYIINIISGQGNISVLFHWDQLTIGPI